MPRGYSPPTLDVSRLQIDTLVAAGAYNAGAYNALLATQVATQAAAAAMLGLVVAD